LCSIGNTFYFKSKLHVRTKLVNLVDVSVG
jgi:hypothetical protein